VKKKNNFLEDVSSVDNTFYMLSKTNRDEGNPSEKISNIGKSFKGQYDQMVEDFEDLVEKRKNTGGMHHISQSQMERRMTPNQGSMSRSHAMVNHQNMIDRQNMGDRQDMVNRTNPSFGRMEQHPQNSGQVFYNEEAYHNEYKPRNSGKEFKQDEVEAYNEIIEKQLRQGRNTGHRVNFVDQNGQPLQKETNYNSDLKEYFDTEVNEILDKIKKLKVEGVSDCDVHLGNKYKLMNCTNSLKKGQMEEMEYREAHPNQGEVDNRRSTHGFKKLQSRRNTEKADEMFEKKDIEELKNRVKAVTTVEHDGNRDGRSQTYMGQLTEKEYIKNLVNPEVNRVGEFEGEIEMMKRKTIQETTKIKVPMEGELLSGYNEGTNARESGTSGNFSFNPKNAKKNLNEQMNELIDEMEIAPVKKNITVSMVIDGLENRNLEDLQNLRDKANTTKHSGRRRTRQGSN
jgi:hypothetical protein